MVFTTCPLRSLEHTELTEKIWRSGFYLSQCPRYPLWWKILSARPTIWV